MRWVIVLLALAAVLAVLYGGPFFGHQRFISADGMNATAWHVIGDVWLTPNVRWVLIWAMSWSFFAGLICGLEIIPWIERKTRRMEGNNEKGKR